MPDGVGALDASDLVLLSLFAWKSECEDGESWFSGCCFSKVAATCGSHSCRSEELNAARAPHPLVMCSRSLAACVVAQCTADGNGAIV
jgi:hypothetical protein